ncbi:MAG: hypothetical protein KY468_09680 [Armatimonadetes bacterium]|nr:hypothetical protein [Armatimonadota bacterium]
METAIVIVWWVGLIGALLLTLVILKLVFLVVGALNDIYRLAEFTRTAARGLAGNAASVERLEPMAEAAQPFRQAACDLVSTVNSIAEKAERLSLDSGGGR